MILCYGPHVILIRRNGQYSAYWHGRHTAGVHASKQAACDYLDTMDAQYASPDKQEIDPAVFRSLIRRAVSHHHAHDAA